MILENEKFNADGGSEKWVKARALEIVEMPAGVNNAEIAWQVVRL